MAVIRVYHFLCAKYALEGIERKRIKISELDTLNDPFELWCSAQDDSDMRRLLREWKAEMAQKYGMVCFSGGWRNPVLWSHYADKHRGICLGLDVEEQFIPRVRYVKHRQPLRQPFTTKTTETLLFTKYWDWSYEQERRGWCPLDVRDPASALFFRDFDHQMQLREVIAGPLCTTPEAIIKTALRDYQGVAVFKSRLAFTKFQVVENQKGFSS
jgi:hypothetical protein